MAYIWHIYGIYIWGKWWAISSLITRTLELQVSKHLGWRAKSEYTDCTPYCTMYHRCPVIGMESDTNATARYTLLH